MTMKQNYALLMVILFGLNCQQCLGTAVAKAASNAKLQEALIEDAIRKTLQSGTIETIDRDPLTGKETTTFKEITNTAELKRYLEQTSKLTGPYKSIAETATNYLSLINKKTSTDLSNIFNQVKKDLDTTKLLSHPTSPPQLAPLRTGSRRPASAARPPLSPVAAPGRANTWSGTSSRGPSPAGPLTLARSQVRAAQQPQPLTNFGASASGSFGPEVQSVGRSSTSSRSSLTGSSTNSLPFVPGGRPSHVGGTGSARPASRAGVR